MSVQKTFTLNPDADITTIINAASQAITSQGYEVQAQILSATSATLVVKKDRDDGFKNFIGLGVECRVSIGILNGNQLVVSIDHEWTNKIIAIAVGWFLCWIVFITGIVGAINQNSLPEKIANAFMIASSSTGGYTEV